MAFTNTILIAHLHNILVFLMVIITCSNCSLGYKMKTYTLEECEKLGKRFCYTGIVPNRHLINEAIRNNEELLKMYDYLKPPFDEVKDYEKRKSRALKRFNRSKRESTATTDCSAICCSVRDTTPPFSYFMDSDGWNQVASTPEFPLRVSFFTEQCSNPNSPCRGVRSTDDEFQAQCEQTEQKHTILLYNKTINNVQSRYISVPSGCKCRLVAKNPFKSPSKERSRRYSENISDGQSYETVDSSNPVLRDNVLTLHSQYYGDINV